MLFIDEDDELIFPPLHLADQHTGILLVGGSLSPERLALAYSLGVFPWFNEGETPPLWHAPHERMVLFLDKLIVNRSLRKSINRGRFELRYNTAFAEVLRRCAEVKRPGQAGTWLSEELQRHLTSLHEQGVAHSAEAWREGQLVGGLYGVAIGRVFFGESMFALEPDASKVVFATLVGRLKSLGYVLVDCQAYSEHLARFGAREMSGALFYSLVSTLAREPLPQAWPT